MNSSHRIHLINLDRDSDRLIKFRERNSHIREIVRPVAVEGRHLDREKLIRDDWITPELDYSYGALGNATSHIDPDDAVLSFGFETRTRGLLTCLPNDWDIVMWGWNFDAFLWVDMIPGVSPAIMQFDETRLRESLDAFQRLDMSPVPLRLLHSFGIMCYTISPRGAKAMVDICLPLTKTLIDFPGFGVTVKNRTIDAMMNAAFPRLKAFVSMPPLAVSENRHDTSTIFGKNRCAAHQIEEGS